MKMVKTSTGILCALILVTISACNFAPVDDSNPLTKSNSDDTAFSYEKQKLLELPGVTEDQAGDVLIPLKINEKAEATLPGENMIIYSLNSEKSEMRDSGKIVSVCKEYKYKHAGSFATAEVTATANLNWSNGSVTINGFDQEVAGSNPYGKIVISNNENTLLKQTGDSAIAEASGNIEFSFTDAKNFSELVAYRFQIIADATSSQSAIIKVIH